MIYIGQMIISQDLKTQTSAYKNQYLSAGYSYSTAPFSGVLPTKNRSSNTQLVASPSPDPDPLDYCIYKQYSEDIIVDPHEIEDTGDWLRCPIQLETVKHYASMLEEDIQAMKRDIRAAPKSHGAEDQSCQQSPRRHLDRCFIE